MKGRKLEAVISLVQPESLEWLSSIHAARKDKRSQWLAEWLFARSGEPALTPEQWWMDQDPDNMAAANPAENEKRLRRWISFLTRECEKALIFQLLEEQPEEVAPTLVRLSPPAWHGPVMGHFAAPVLKYAERQQDHDLIWNSRNHLIRSLLNEQSEKSLGESLDLVIEQLKSLRELFHRRQLDAMGFLSNLYLENSDIRQKAAADFPTPEELDQYCRETAGSPMEAEYWLIRARFSHKDREAFTIAIAQSELLASKLTGRQHDQVARRIHFLRLIAGYGHGQTLRELLAHAKSVHDINEKYGLPDAAGFFHYLLLLILSHQTPQAAILLGDRGSHYFPTTHQYLRDFLHGLAALVQPGKLPGGATKLQALSYSRYVYIALWAGLLFAAHHLRLGNPEIVQTVLERMRKKLHGHQGHFFTREASVALLEWMEKEVERPNSQKPPIGLTPFHDAVIAIAQGLRR